MIKFHRAALLASLILALGAGAAAAESSAKNKDGEERADDVVCTYEPRIGSHLKQRVCATRQAREDKRKADQEMMKRQTTRGGGNAGADPAGL